MPAILIIALMFLQVLSSNVYAGNGDVKKEKVNTTDSALVEENKFIVDFNAETGKINVSVIGSFDSYSSVSVTNNRGSEYRFSFIENGSNSIVFNVQDLKPGAYFVVLNSGEEIRMKRFMKN